MKDMKDFNKEIIVKPRIRPIRPHIKIKPQIDNNFIKSPYEINSALSNRKINERLS